LELICRSRECTSRPVIEATAFARADDEEADLPVDHDDARGEDEDRARGTHEDAQRDQPHAAALPTADAIFTPRSREIE